MTSATTATENETTKAPAKAKKPPLTLEEKLAKITEKKAKVEAALQAQRRRKAAAENRKLRQENTRRKILLGAAVLEAQCENTAEALQAFLHVYLTRDEDRKLFGLPERDLPPLPPEIQKERVAGLGLAIEMVVKPTEELPKEATEGF